MAGPVVGRECYLYYNAGTYGSPTWTLITKAIDVSYSIGSERGDLSSRRSLWKMEGKSLNSLEVTFGYRYHNGTDTVQAALRGAAMLATKTELAVADGPIATTGTQYLRGTYQFEMNNDQGMTNGVALEFTAFLTYEEDSATMREPAWTTV